MSRFECVQEVRVMGDFTCCSGWLQKAVLLQNVGCSGSLCSPAGRTFSADWNSDISRVDDVTSGSFFDFYDDVR